MPITLRMNMRKIPKSYEPFKKLLPSDGFCELYPEKFKQMMKIIHNEPDKNLKHIYFTLVLDKLFSNGWGWYGRLGQSLSGLREMKSASQLPAKRREAGLQVLRIVKDMHIELKYSPSHIMLINEYIREFGGKLQSREEKSKQAVTKFKSAVTALKAGEKLPRKLKKQIQTKIQGR